MQVHPDTEGGEGKADRERFELITAAYEVLSDPGKRSTYDQVCVGVGVGVGVVCRCFSISVNRADQLTNGNTSVVAGIKTYRFPYHAPLRDGSVRAEPTLCTRPTSSGGGFAGSCLPFIPLLVVCMCELVCECERALAGLRVKVCQCVTLGVFVNIHVFADPHRTIPFRLTFRPTFGLVKPPP